jgi:hypothetical protein
MDGKMDAPGFADEEGVGAAVISKLDDIVGFVELLKGLDEDDLEFDVLFFRVTPTATPTTMLSSTRNAMMPITIAPFLDLQNDGGGDVPLGPYVSLAGASCGWL